MRPKSWREICREIRREIAGRRRIDRRLSGEISEKLDRLKKLFILEVVGGELDRARSWSSELKKTLELVKGDLKLDEIVFPRELGSFLGDPEAHLRKKLFIYAMDLARRRMSIKAFEERGRRAVQTSLQTNLRNIYQSWVFLTILRQVSANGSLIYPEHGYLSLERSGRQRLSSIPPNAVVDAGGGLLSFFLEAPRPIAWEDTEDLRRVWRLYKAMRPDILVYGGKVLDIFAEELDPPIKRPDAIIECKELEDWYRRVRELRADDKPISAEEWRWMWLRGLWTGLGRELGARVKPKEVEAGSSRRIRLKEQELVKIYARLYKPKEMILVSRCRTPADVRRDLEAEGIEVFDDVRFDPEKLKEVSKRLLEYATPSEDIIVLRGELARMIKKMSRALRRSPEELIREAVEAIGS